MILCYIYFKDNIFGFFLINKEKVYKHCKFCQKLGFLSFV
jgi:hypothetical protein